MNEDRRIRIAITQGDTNGVGLELILKAFEDPTMFELCTPVVYGSPKVASYYRKVLGSDVSYTVINDAHDARDGQLNLLAVIQDEVKIDMGQPTVESAEAAVKALAKAVADVRDGLMDGLVAGPVNERGFDFKDLHFDSQTELVAQLLERHARKMAAAQGNAGADVAAEPGTATAAVNALRLLVGDECRVATLTDGGSLRNAADMLTTESVASKAAQLLQVLRRDLDVNNPRVAVLAWNARGGRDDRPGYEELDIIAPAVEQLSQDGRQVFGPYSAERLMMPDRLRHYDAVLAMHRDQVVAPFHLMEQGDGVVLSAGLPIVMAEPGHGACFDIAGKNIADVSAMRAAIYMVTDVVRQRSRYDEPMGNPLPKLYHERRDESEKVRFRSNDRREPDAAAAVGQADTQAEPEIVADES